MANANTSVLQWGKPIIEFGKLGSNDAPPTVWKLIDTPVENTTKLNAEKGEEKTAKEEGGGIVDKIVGKSNYSLEFELYIKNGKTIPIAEEDGVINGLYAIRWISEKTQTGYLIDKATVSAQQSYDTENGGKLKYTFSALKPKIGSIVKEYHK